jgi:PleD family two-component response regulator
MTQPLALVVYERLLPGTQLINRLQDMNYRVLAITDPATLLTCAQQEKPMVVLADLVSTKNNVCSAIEKLKQTAETQHIPIVAIAPDEADDLQKSARAAGVALVVSETAVLNHLPQFLEQALQIE